METGKRIGSILMEEQPVAITNNAQRIMGFTSRSNSIHAYILNVTAEGIAGGSDGDAVLNFFHLYSNSLVVQTHASVIAIPSRNHTKIPRDDIIRQKQQSCRISRMTEAMQMDATARNPNPSPLSDLPAKPVQYHAKGPSGTFHHWTSIACS